VIKNSFNWLRVVRSLRWLSLTITNNNMSVMSLPQMLNVHERQNRARKKAKSSSLQKKLNTKTEIRQTFRRQGTHYIWATWFLIFIFSLFFSGPCAGLSRPSRQLLNARKFRPTVSYRIVQANVQIKSGSNDTTVVDSLWLPFYLIIAVKYFIRFAAFTRNRRYWQATTPYSEYKQLNDSLDILLFIW